MLLIIIGVIAYVLAGMVVGRNTYALRAREYAELANNEEARDARIEELKLMLGKLTHGICNLNYSTMRHRGCDCWQEKKWREYHSELDRLQNGGLVEKTPSLPLDAVALWPWFGFKQFLTPPIDTAKAVQTPEPAPIRQLAATPNEYRWIDVYNDPIMQALKARNDRVAALAEAELGKINKNDPNAYVSVGDNNTYIVGGDGKVLKRWDNYQDDNPEF